MNAQDPSLQTLQEIKRMMERSSRFLSLSGLSGVSAGVCAILGALWAHSWLLEYANQDGGRADLHTLQSNLLALAAAVLLVAIVSSLYFTWKKARKNNLPVWDHTAKKLLINLLIPLVSGGLFAAGLLFQGHWELVAPTCLVFYGLALVNASKYTLSDIRYLGLLEIALGLGNMFYEAYGLYFWTIGFGLLHIIYGLIMWRRYDMELGEQKVEGGI